jgi:hypothetical protein
MEHVRERLHASLHDGDGDGTTQQRERERGEQRLEKKMRERREVPMLSVGRPSSAL